MGAVGGEEGEVVRLAVRPSILLKEVAVPQLGLTLGADKVLWVPHPSQRRHHLQQEINQLSTGPVLLMSGGWSAAHLPDHWFLTG